MRSWRRDPFTAPETKNLVDLLTQQVMKKATGTVYSGSEQVMTSFPPPASPGNRISAVSTLVEIPLTIGEEAEF